MNYSDKQIRLIRSLRDSGLDWGNVTDEYNKRQSDLSNPATPNALRKIYARYKDDDLDDDTFVSKVKSLHKTSYENKKLKKENKYIIEKVITHDDFLAEVSKISKLCPIKLHPKINPLKKPKCSKRTIVAHISDTHFGCRINREELDGVNEYNSVIASRRMALLANHIVNYKTSKRKETNLKLVLNGDMFAGVIYNQEGGVELISTQFSIGLRILSQFISFVAGYFNNVEIVGISGNHTRMMHKQDKGRAVSQKYDSFETLLYISLKETFKDYTNVSFEIPSAPYARFKLYGFNYLATHGDTVISVGNTGKSINIEKITNSINNFTVALKENINVVMLGHVHMASISQLNNGEFLVINGTLSGVDSFAQSLGYVSNNIVQEIFEVTETHPLGDIRLIDVSAADKNTNLDKIIEPPMGLF